MGIKHPDRPTHIMMMVVGDAMGREIRVRVFQGLSILSGSSQAFAFGIGYGM
jgi:hypothetical protein